MRLRGGGLKRGVVTLCIGGGQGIALALGTVQWSFSASLRSKSL
jgi:hypothetical protein